MGLMNGWHKLGLTIVRASVVWIALSALACERHKSVTKENQAPARRQVSRPAAKQPPPSLSDLLVGVKHPDSPLLLLRGDAGGVARGERLWLICENAVVEAEAVGVQQTDPAGPAGDEPCVSPKMCPLLTVVKPARKVDCAGDHFLGLPASFDPPRPIRPRREHRFYQLKDEACGLADGKHASRDSPPSDVQKLVAEVHPRLVSNPYSISSLFIDGLDPLHWVVGTAGRGRQMEIVWSVLAQTATGMTTLINKTRAVPPKGTDRLRTRHMMHHTCGLPFYSVARPVLFFAMGDSAERFVVTAEQRPSDTIRFAFWELSKAALRQRYRFPVELPAPKF